MWETRGGRGEKKEMWWWSNEVQDKIKAKKSARYKELQAIGLELEEQEKQKEDANRVAKKEAKKALAKPRWDAGNEFYNNLDTRDGEAAVYRIAKQSKGCQQERTWVSYQ